jgi:hypothetical protein
MLDVGDPSTALATPYNRAVRVEDGTDLEEEGHRFRIVPEGSGSGSGQEKLPEQVLAKVCRSDQPIPTILTLKLDGTLAKGSCSNTGELNRPVTLRFSMVEPFVGRWLSKPIALGEKKPGPPAFWVLEKKNAKTWTLTLRQQNKKIAVYVCKTKEAKDCSMPIQLKLKGAKGKHFKKWPRLAKVKPAKAAQ